MSKRIVLIFILLFSSYSYSSPFLDRCRTAIKALNVAVGVAQLYRKVRHIEPVEEHENGSLKQLFRKNPPIDVEEYNGEKTNGFSSLVRVQIEMALSARKMGRKRGAQVLKRMLDQKLFDETLVVVIQVAGELGGTEGSEIMNKIFDKNLLSTSSGNAEEFIPSEN